MRRHSVGRVVAICRSCSARWLCASGRAHGGDRLVLQEHAGELAVLSNSSKVVRGAIHAWAELAAGHQPVF
jgi:hypothetical protein